jgi:hypothetical protein
MRRAEVEAEPEEAEMCGWQVMTLQVHLSSFFLLRLLSFASFLWVAYFT